MLSYKTVFFDLVITIGYALSPAMNNSLHAGTFPDRPWGLPSLLYNGYRVFPGGKAAGA